MQNHVSSKLLRYGSNFIVARRNADLFDLRTEAHTSKHVVNHWQSMQVRKGLAGKTGRRHPSRYNCDYSVHTFSVRGHCGIMEDQNSYGQPESEPSFPFTFCCDGRDWLWPRQSLRIRHRRFWGKDGCIKISECLGHISPGPCCSYYSAAQCLAHSSSSIVGACQSSTFSGRSHSSRMQRFG